MTKEIPHMRRITRLRPTPAMVVATIALLVALGGTSVAAVALVPRNSVGSDQVINHSLKAKDFAAGQVLPGSDTLTQSVAGPVPTPADAFSTIASLSVSKPGAYVIWSTARVEGRNIGGECHLLAGDSVDVSKSAPGASTATLWNVAVQSFAAPASVDLQCGGIAKGLAEVTDIQLTALRLASPNGA
ncbi:MAG TPA: hypothetical protein VLJ76_02245 [Gaiellaceae bacterium]|nr:hypothetical protein [Gaiellaceae bacterium]